MLVKVSLTTSADGRIQICTNGSCAADTDWSSTATVVFDGSNWNSGFEVRVRAVDDFVPQDPQTSVITHTVVQDGTPNLDLSYTFPKQLLAVDVYDDDTPNVVVDETGGSTLLLNNGKPCTDPSKPCDDYSVRLTEKPTGTVTLSIVGDGQADVVSVDGTPLTPADYVAIGGIRPSTQFTGNVDTTPTTITRGAGSELGSFVRDGFTSGQLIQVQGFTAQYTVTAVTDTSLTVQVAVAGTQFGTASLTNVKIDALIRTGIFTGAVTYDAATNAVIRSDGSNWIADGFREGQRIRILGGPNAGDYKIALIDGPAGSYATVMHLTLEHAIAAAAGGTVTITETAAQVTFTPSNFYVPQDVQLKADPNFTIPTFRQNTKPFPVLPDLLTRIRGPLEVEGGVTGADRSLQPAIMLPHERNADLLGVAPQPPEYFQVDTLNVYDDSSQQDKTGELTSVGITGLGMVPDLPDFSAGTAFGEPTIVPKGISYSSIVVTHDQFGHEVIDPTSTKTTIESVNLLLGKGNDHVTITSTLVPGPDHAGTNSGPGIDDEDFPLPAGVDPNNTPSAHGGITTVHGGGNHTLTVTGNFLVAGTSVQRLDHTSWADAGFAVGQLVSVAGGATLAITGFGGTNGDTLQLTGAPSSQGTLTGATVTVIDPKTGTARVGGDTITVTGGPTTLAAGGPASPLVIYGDTSQDGKWYSGDTVNPQAPRFDDLLPQRPNATGFYTKPFDQIGTADDFFYFPAAYPFRTPGNDVIDASLAFSALPASGLGSTATGTSGVTVGITAYGGRGDDVIYGSQAGDYLAGGSGDDLIVGGRGIDQIYGDSGINVDPLSRNLAIPTAAGSTYPTRDDLSAGSDTLHGDLPGTGFVQGYTPAPAFVDPGTSPDSAYKDIIFGDHGVVTQDIPYLRSNLLGAPVFVRLLTTLRDTQAQTTNPQNGAPDVITGDLATDRIFGGQGGDTILGNEGDDLILGDQGYIHYPTPDSGAEMPDVVTTCMDPNLNVCAQNTGGNDLIDGSAGNDIVFGATGSDTISGGAGNDLIFGDFGAVVGIAQLADGSFPYADHLPRIDTRLLPVHVAVLPNDLHTFGWTSIETTTADAGAADLIRGNAGDDVIVGGQGADQILGDDGNDDIIGGHTGWLTPLRLGTALTIGARYGAAGSDTGDTIDGGAGNDWIEGDNGILLRTGSSIGPRFRDLQAQTIFDANGNDLIVDNGDVYDMSAWQLDPNNRYGLAGNEVNPNGNEERYVELFDQSGSNPIPGTFGNDNIAGGAQDDVIFGQLGDDTIQGDGSTLDDSGARTIDVLGTRMSVEDYAGIGADGRDWVEGNGGNDTIFGGLGQDDLIGGSSNLYSLKTPDQRPDGSDVIFGGAGVRLERDNYGDLSGSGHAHDADTILGDNGDIFNLVGINGQPSSPYGFLTFNYDTYDSTERIIPRAYRFLDYTQGDSAAAGTIGAADLIHGENGDDTIHGMVGDDVLFGEGEDDNIYGGTGNDRIYGGTGEDGILGDDGVMLTSRNGLIEPLNRLFTPNLEYTVIESGPVHLCRPLHPGRAVQDGAARRADHRPERATTRRSPAATTSSTAASATTSSTASPATTRSPAPRRRSRSTTRTPSSTRTRCTTTRRPRSSRPTTPTTRGRSSPAGSSTSTPTSSTRRPGSRSTRTASSSSRTTAATGSTATSATTGSSAAPTATGSSAASATTTSSSTTTCSPTTARTTTRRTTTRASATATSPSAAPAATC